MDLQKMFDDAMRNAIRPLAHHSLLGTGVRFYYIGKLLARDPVPQPDPVAAAMNEKIDGMFRNYFSLLYLPVFPLGFGFCSNFTDEVCLLAWSSAPSRERIVENNRHLGQAHKGVIQNWEVRGLKRMLCDGGVCLLVSVLVIAGAVVGLRELVPGLHWSLSLLAGLFSSGLVNSFWLYRGAERSARGTSWNRPDYARSHVVTFAEYLRRGYLDRV